MVVRSSEPLAPWQMDINGHLAAATSTGGMTNKRFQRIGDSPIMSAGTYANDASCAISCTGHGESFMRAVVAFDVHALMSYKGLSLAEAVRIVVHDKLPPLDGEGGLIAVDHLGNIVLDFNSSGMYRGQVGADGVFHGHLALSDLPVRPRPLIQAADALATGCATLRRPSPSSCGQPEHRRSHETQYHHPSRRRRPGRPLRHQPLQRGEESRGGREPGDNGHRCKWPIGPCRQEQEPRKISGGAANYESQTLKDVVEARSKAISINLTGDDLTPEKIAQFEQAQANLGGAIGRLLVENYPTLQAVQSFRDFQTQYEGMENRIARERALFNDAVANYNSRIVTFPGQPVRRHLRLQGEDRFHVDARFRERPRHQVPVSIIDRRRTCFPKRNASVCSRPFTRLRNAPAAKCASTWTTPSPTMCWTMRPSCSRSWACSAPATATACLST